MFSELRQALRSLLDRPLVSVAAVITLALGIGANTAIFTVVNSVLLRPLPYEDPGRLMVVWGQHPQVGTETASYPDFLDWRTQNGTFSGMAAVSSASFNLTGVGEPVRLSGARVTTDFFDLLSSAPALGRDFADEEHAPGGPHVVVLGHRLWKERFGGAADVLGRAVTLDGDGYTVVGIAREGFAFPSTADFWTPLALAPETTGRRSDFLLVLGRLAAGVSRDGAQVDLDRITAGLEEAYPDTNAGWSALVVPLHEEMVHDVRPALLLLLGSVGFVLLIACANVANLLLVRAAARSREIAIRAALGASWRRIARQMLTESALLAGTGGAFGLLLAHWGVDLLLALQPPGIPRLSTTAIDPTVLAFTAGVSILTGLLFGSFPVFQAATVHLGNALKDGRTGTASGTPRQRTRAALVITEVALSLVLLISAGLAMRSFNAVSAVDAGFRSDNLLTCRLSVPESRYPEDHQVASFFRRVQERVAALPGAREVALTGALPTLGGGPWWSLAIEGREDPADGDVVDANIRIVSANYLSTVGIPVVRGRHLSPADDAGAPNVVLVNETLARRYWPGEDPVGRRVAFDGDGDGPNWREIVGVVADVRHEGLDRDEVRGMYVPHAQVARPGMALVIRTEGEPLALAGAVRTAVVDIDPEQPVYGLRSMEQILAGTLAQREFALVLLAVFAGVALFLATIGIYGVVSYTVAQRTREFGIRVALGAGRGDIMGMVLRQGMRLTIVGLALGLALALAVTRLMTGLLYGVGAADPLTFFALPAAMALVALLASGVPAWRATRVAAIRALRYE